MRFSFWYGVPGGALAFCYAIIAPSRPPLHGASILLWNCRKRDPWHIRSKIMAHLDTPLSDLNAYVQFFARQPIPVLRHTQMRLDEMREMEDQLNGRALAGLVLSDPLMTLKVLLHIEAHRGARQNHDITTVERAIMM